MKAYWARDVLIHIFLTSALVAGEWSVSRLCPFTPGERAPGTHWIGGWVDPRARLDDVEKRRFLNLLGLKLQHLGHPASSQSLYRLRYSGSTQICCTSFKVDKVWAILPKAVQKKQHFLLYFLCGKRINLTHNIRFLLVVRTHVYLMNQFINLD
jgi:hypothetical protein